MNLRSILLMGLLILLWIVNPVSSAVAISDPLGKPNNKFGIHILEPQDIPAAAALVNSNGGDWGYVTLVIREDDRNLEKWQLVFEQLRHNRLIPIVRIATRFEGQQWIAPRVEDVEPWVVFLNSLNWVIKNRYVIIFNEPNQAHEWGGVIKPNEYASIYNHFYSGLKHANRDFFILPAGLDVAAPNSLTTMDPYEFLNQLHQADPKIFSKYDGWTAHAYPNPNFTGSVWDKSSMSVTSYLWEISHVSKLGYDSNKPIFITETGWATNQGIDSPPSFLNLETAAANMATSYLSIWTDPRIVAITPFVLNYDHPPFEQFSWLDPKSRMPNIVYRRIQALPKNAGNPEQIDSLVVDHKYFPKTLITDSKYLVAVSFRNTGQTIWSKAHQFKVTYPHESELNISTQPLSVTPPGSIAKIWLTIHTPLEPKSIPIELSLVNGDHTLTTLEYDINVVKSNHLINRLKVWFDDLIQADFSEKL